MMAPIETDALVVGAGPVGLFQVFQLGLQGISAHVVDSLAVPGGQCVELYADKPIYDIPAVPVCTGRELIERLVHQIQPFGATFHLDQEVSQLRRVADGRFEVQTSRGVAFLARTIFVAAGVGAFQPRRVKLAALDAHQGSQLFYRVDDPAPWAGQHAVVVGGDTAAVESAIALAEPGPHRAASVTLLHRRDVLEAPAPTLARMQALRDAGALAFVVGQPSGIRESAGRLTGIEATGPDGEMRSLALDRLLVRLGLAPKLGPVAQWGLALERKQLVVDTATFASSTPGIFAVGDVNTYPGKRKLIVSGFHEATLAAFAAAALVFPDQPVQLQYTTTSPTLHRRLGLATPGTN